MRTFIALCLVFSITGCTTFFHKKVTQQDLTSSNAATKIQAVAKTASATVNAAKVQVKKIDKATKTITPEIPKMQPPIAAKVAPAVKSITENNEGIDTNLDIIKDTLTTVDDSSNKILDVSQGSWSIAGWLKWLGLIIITIIILIVFIIITVLLKQWGVLSYVKVTNEAIAKSVAHVIDKSPDIDNNEAPPVVRKIIEQMHGDDLTEEERDEALNLYRKKKKKSSK